MTEIKAEITALTRVKHVSPAPPLGEGYRRRISLPVILIAIKCLAILCEHVHQCRRRRTGDRVGRARVRKLRALKLNNVTAHVITTSAFSRDRAHCRGNVT